MNITHRLAAMAAVSVAAQLILSAPLAGTAGATLPGSNGRIAFTKGCCESQDIYFANPDGSDLTKLDVGGMDAGSPSWAPDGSRIVAEVSDLHPTIRIATMAPDGSDMRFLTNGRIQAHAPAFSPGGSTVVYTTEDGLVTKASDGSGGPTQLVSGVVMEPSYSPDGTTIVYAAAHGPNVRRRWNLFVVGSDGSNAHRITSTPLRQEMDPSYSPDGTSIVYTAKDQVSRYESDSDVRMLDLATQHSRVLFGSPDLEEYAGPVSPDGSRIAWVQYDASHHASLVVSNLDGTNPVIIDSGDVPTGFGGIDWLAT